MTDNELTGWVVDLIRTTGTPGVFLLTAGTILLVALRMIDAIERANSLPDRVARLWGLPPLRWLKSVARNQRTPILMMFAGLVLIILHTQRLLVDATSRLDDAAADMAKILKPMALDKAQVDAFEAFPSPIKECVNSEHLVVQHTYAAKTIGRARQIADLVSQHGWSVVASPTLDQRGVHRYTTDDRKLVFMVSPIEVDLFKDFKRLAKAAKLDLKVEPVAHVPTGCIEIQVDDLF